MPLRRLMPLPLVACGLLAGGCSEESRTVAEVRQEYVSCFLEGITFGDSGEIRAADFDEETLELVEVTVTDNVGNLYHARRAVVLVDVDADTVSLRLLDITGASPASGEVWTAAALVTPPEKVACDVR